MSDQAAVLRQRLEDREAHLAEVKRRVKKHEDNGNDRKVEAYKAAVKRAEQEVKDLKAELKEAS